MKHKNLSIKTVSNGWVIEGGFLNVLAICQTIEDVAKAVTDLSATPEDLPGIEEEEKRKAEEYKQEHRNRPSSLFGF
jgi:hypothetical protein